MRYFWAAVLNLLVLPLNIIGIVVVLSYMCTLMPALWLLITLAGNNVDVEGKSFFEFHWFVFKVRPRHRLTPGPFAW